MDPAVAVYFLPDLGPMIAHVIAYVMGALIAKFMRPIWGPSGADRTQVGPILVP